MQQRNQYYKLAMLQKLAIINEKQTVINQEKEVLLQFWVNL